MTRHVGERLQFPRSRARRGDEDGFSMSWVRHHDRYVDGRLADPTHPYGPAQKPDPACCSHDGQATSHRATQQPQRTKLKPSDVYSAVTFSRYSPPLDSSPFVVVLRRSVCAERCSVRWA